jgi:C_GCAxxG_C_C family probable redox protein
MSKKVDEAVRKFQRGFSCSQSIFSTFSEDYGLNSETALKIASAFSGGIGHLGETCGVVTGAFMVIGLKHGKGRALSMSENAVIDELIIRFIEEFKRRNGSIICKELLDYSVSLPSENPQGVSSSRCSKFVRDSAEILEEIL